MKTEEEADFFSIINETISHDDINFSDFVTIFKTASNTVISEEQMKNTLKEFCLDGGYELKEIKFQYTINKINDKALAKVEEKSLLLTSLSQLPTVKNNLIICCLTPMNNYIKNISNLNFSQFWQKKSKDSKELLILKDLILIYISDTKVRGLYDSQYMFPNLFKVKHIFQLILSKSLKDNILFEKHLEEYENCISYNSFHIAQKKVYKKLSELNEDLEKNIHIISSNKNSYIKFTENFEILKNFYLNNEKFQEFACALTHLTYIGNNDCLKRFSSEISFNNNFFIINYDKENDCDELIKLFMELPEEMNYYYRFSDIKLFRPQNFSSFQRIILIFKPFICRNNLNDIVLNIFKVNNFKILIRKTLVLSDDDSNYLYHHECPNEDVSFKNYYHMMTDSKCEIVLLSKFRAFSEAHAILGSNKSVLTSNNGQSNNNFINIYSLINREISKLLEKNEQNLINEQIKLVNFDNVNKEYFTKLNEKNLLVKDYKEIEKKINEDKKKCQKCGCSLNGEEQRRGWKNELGEYTLLCVYCAKKYYDGAHELRYDLHDNQINYNTPINYNYNNISNSMKNPIYYQQLKNGLGNNNYSGISASHGYKNTEEIYEQVMKNGANIGQLMDGSKPKFVSFQVGKDLINK